MKIRYNAPVILTYALLSISLLLVETLTGFHLVRNYFTAAPYLRLSEPLQYFRLVSYVCGHINWTHLVGNFTIILLVGPLLEEKYGSLKLLEMIGVTAVVTALLNALLFSSGLLGASGIAFMLILLGSFSNIRTGEVPLTFVIVAGLFLGGEVLRGVSSDNISQFAHVAGGTVGALYGFARK